MARKPAHWMLRVALGLGLPAVAATLMAADMNPTLAAAPTGGSSPRSRHGRTPLNRRIG